MTAQIERVSRNQLLDIMSAMNLGPESQEAFHGLIGFGCPLWVGYIDNKLVCFWGLKPMTLLSNAAYLWLHTTEDLKGHEFIFIRKSQIVIREMLKSYTKICGHTFKNQEQSVRWLTLLGAKFEQHSQGVLSFTIGGE